MKAPMRVLVAAYVIVAVTTFGHNYNVNHVGGSMFVSAEERNAIGSLFAGAFWPLYWSVQVFKPLRAEAKHGN